MAWAIAFGFAVTWPLLVFRYPPFQDLPNHLARVFVLLNPDDPLLSQRFIIDWKAVPNLAWDAFGVVVGQWLALDLTLKLFLFLSLGLTLAGVFLLNRAIVGRWTWAPLLVAPFLFNAGYTRGFLSFNLGVGLALVASAWWAGNDESRWRRRLAVACLFSTALFFTHLVAWGCYGLFILGLKLQELVRQGGEQRSKAWPAWLGGIVRDGLQVVPPIAIMWLSSWFFGNGADLVGVIAEFEWPHDRIRKAWHIIDVGMEFPSLLILAIAAPVALWQLWRRRARIAEASLFVIPLLMVLYFVLPDQIYATHFIVWRFALFAVLYALAAAIPAESITAPSSRKVMATFLVLTFALAGWQAYSAANSEAAHRDFSQLIARVPEGSTLLVEHAGLEPYELEFDRLGLYHMGAFAVIERRIMVQSLFANPAQQPISYRQAAFANSTVNGRVFTQDLAGALNTQGLSFADHLANFDWLAIHGPDAESDASSLPLGSFRLTEEIGDFRLYCRAVDVIDPLSSGARTVCPDGSQI